MPNRASNRALIGLLSVGFLLIFAFQNFSNIDIRDLAPKRPDHFTGDPHVLRAPENADSAQGAGLRWLERETRPFVAPLEKDWLASVNGRINRFFRFEPVRGEDWPETSDESPQGESDDLRAPASDDAPAMPNIKMRPDGSPDPESFKDLFSLNAYAPQSVRLTKTNEITFGFSRGTDLSCEIQNGQSTFKLSRPISSASSLDLSHQTGDGKNSMHFKYSW